MGHVGLFRFDYHNQACELDNIIRGVDGISKGLMTQACQTIIDFAKKDLGIRTIYLRVFSDNEAALKIYHNLSFKEIIRTPLRKEQKGEVVFWKEIISDPYFSAEKYFVTMKLGLK